MREAVSQEYPVLRRRSLVRWILAGAAVQLCSPAIRTAAQNAIPIGSPVPGLEQLFPDERELPAGVELESAGTREEVAQIAGTFRNSRDAAQLLSGWDWAGNAYRSYGASVGAGSATPVRVEISIDQFASSTGAAYALSYFAHDWAVVLQRHEAVGETLLPCEAMVTGDGSATRFLRRGNLVVRVTVVMPEPAPAEADTIALTAATDLALAVLANAEDLGLQRSATC